MELGLPPRLLRRLLLGLLLVGACGRVDYQSTEQEPSADSSVDATMDAEGGPLDAGPVDAGPDAPVDAGGPTCPLGEGRLTSGAPGCSVLPAPSGSVECVGPAQASELPAIVSGLEPDTTLLFADGTYSVEQTLEVTTPGVSLRSASRDPAAVTLDGAGTLSELIRIEAEGVTVASLTLSEPAETAVHVTTPQEQPELQMNTRLHNLHVVDSRLWGVMVGPPRGQRADSGELSCSTLELTDNGRSAVSNCTGVGGLHIEESRNWQVRGNVLQGFWCLDGIPRAMIATGGSRDLVIERNIVRNNFIGIALGSSSETVQRTYDDSPCAEPIPGTIGVTVRNNFVFARDVNPYFDGGIPVWRSCNVDVMHNSVIPLPGTDPYHSIEWRFSETQNVRVWNNLVSAPTAARNGGTADEQATVQLTDQALSDVFEDVLAGDLHLTEAATMAIDQGVDATTVAPEDFDGQTRSDGMPDIGADERP
jgi:parallel beta-helix repeat protein